MYKASQTAKSMRPYEFTHSRYPDKGEQDRIIWMNRITPEIRVDAASERITRMHEENERQNTCKMDISGQKPPPRTGKE